jgi:hypothetical protein
MIKLLGGLTMIFFKEKKISENKDILLDVLETLYGIGYISPNDMSSF